jgi:hypothetical protein
MNNNGKGTEVNINDMYTYDDYDMNVDYYESHNKRCTNIEPNNINNATIINLNTNQPIGIDLSKFDSNINNMNQTMHSISTANDLPLISEVL